MMVSQFVLKENIYKGEIRALALLENGEVVRVYSNSRRNPGPRWARGAWAWKIYAGSRDGARALINDLRPYLGSEGLKEVRDRIKRSRFLRKVLGFLLPLLEEEIYELDKKEAERRLRVLGLWRD